jgi:integrase
VLIFCRFSTDVLEQPLPENSFVQAPTTLQIQLYLEWFAQSRTGLLDENVTDVTVRNRLACLKRAVKLHTQYQYTPLQNAEIDKFISKSLISGKLVSTSARPKPLAPLAVAEDIIRFLFTCDEYRGLHFRLRNQLAFAIQLMLLIGVRPGEIIESDAWHQSNEGLHYKDIELIHQCTATYQGWLLYVKLRNRKGHREYKKHA